MLLIVLIRVKITSMVVAIHVVVHSNEPCPTSSRSKLCVFVQTNKSYEARGMSLSYVRKVALLSEGGFKSGSE